MKVLKSGIEMTPAEQKKIKGAYCACGCGLGFNGENLCSMGGSGVCTCGCFGTTITAGDYSSGERQ